MTDHDRNIRTLVICFVLAVMALIPLRLTEVGGNLVDVSNSQVLGDTITAEEEVVLPSAELSYWNRIKILLSVAVWGS